MPHDVAKEYGLFRCLPTPSSAREVVFSLLRWFGYIWGEETNKTTRKHCSNPSISLYERLGTSGMQFDGCFNHIVAFYIAWYNNQPRREGGGSNHSVLTTQSQSTKYSTAMFISTIDSCLVGDWPHLHNNSSHTSQNNSLEFWSKWHQKLEFTEWSWPFQLPMPLHYCFVVLFNASECTEWRFR